MPSTPAGDLPLFSALIRMSLHLSLLVLFSCALPLAGLGLLIVLSSQTGSGRLCGLSAFLGGCSLILLPLACYRSRPRRLGLAAGLIALLLLLFVAWQSPRGVSPKGATFQSVYLDGQKPARWHLAYLFPEADQFQLATWLLPFLDPHIDWQKGARLRRLFGKVYTPMELDPEFQVTGSVMPGVFRAFGGADSNSAHLYQYIPGTAPDEALPVVLFLHGSMGNFKGYMWQWRSFADVRKVAVIAPDGGLGNWSVADTRQILDRSLAHIDTHPQLDGKRILLVGLSNGAKGLSRAVAAEPGRWRHLTCISPALGTDHAQALAENLGADASLQLIHGQYDLRVPLQGLRSVVLPALENSAARVSLELIRDQDHYMFFSQPEAVFSLLPERW